MVEPMNANIVVRNRRKESRFYIDNEFLNGYAKKVGLAGQSVYMALCRHEREGKAFPGVRHLSAELNVSIGFISKGIKNLANYGIIKTSKGRQGKYTYYLIDHSKWQTISKESWSNKKREKRESS